MNYDIPPASSQPVKEVLGNAVASMLEDYISPKGKTVQKRGPKISPGKACSSREVASKKKKCATQEQSSSEDDEEVCAICQRWNPPKESRSKGKVDWEGCDHCDLWYHRLCLDKKEELSATDYCNCH